jgi:hypothetical protein
MSANDSKADTPSPAINARFWGNSGHARRAKIRAPFRETVGHLGGRRGWACASLATGIVASRCPFTLTCLHVCVKSLASAWIPDGSHVPIRRVQEGKVVSSFPIGSGPSIAPKNPPSFARGSRRRMGLIHFIIAVADQASNNCANT